MTQTAIKAKDPLTTGDREIIATIVNESDYSHDCKPEDVVTLWINSDDIVWVKMTHGDARYHKEPFKRAVAEVKESLSTPLERNQQLDDELKETADKIGTKNKLFQGLLINALFISITPSLRIKARKSSLLYFVPHKTYR